MQMKSETNKENNNKKQKSQEVKRKGEGERQYVVSAKMRARPHRRRFTCVCVCVCVKDNAPENARKEAAALYAANKTGETMSLGVANTVSLYQAPRIPKSQVQ